MTWNWPLAVVIMALLLFGYCAYATHEAGRSVDRALDNNLTAERCYSAGYQVGSTGGRAQATPTEEDCARWFGIGVSDGQRLYDLFKQ